MKPCFLLLALALFLLFPAPDRAQNPPSPAVGASEWKQKFEEVYKSGHYEEAAADLRKTIEIEAVSQSEAAAADLTTLGIIYDDTLKQPEKAVACYQQGITYARQAQNTKLEKRLLDFLGFSYQKQRDYKQAMSAYSQELELARKQKDQPAQVRLLDEMAGIQFVRVADYSRAAELYEQELVLLKAQGSSAALLETLNRLQSLYFLIERYDKAAEIREQQLAAQRDAGDREGARKTLGFIGSTYAKAGLYGKAVPAYEELLAQQRADKDQPGEARTLNNLAFAYRKLRRPEKVLDLLEQSLAVNQALENRAGIERVLVNLGAVHVLDLQQYDQGIALYEQALTMRREDKDPEAEGETLSSIGLAYVNSNRCENGLVFCRQALVLQQSVKDQEGAAKTLNNIGLAYLNLNQPDKAVAVFQQAAVLMRRAKNQSGEILALTGLGNAYSHLGEYRRAIECYRQALAVNQSLKDPEIEATVLNNMAGIYRDQGNYAGALQTVKEVVAVFHMLGDAKIEATAQMNLGEIYGELGQQEKAIELFTQALAVQRGIGDRLGMVRTLGNLGAAAANLGRNEEALGYDTQSLALAREMRDRAEEGTVLTNMGIVQGDLGQTQKAEDSFRQALAIFAETEDVRSTAVTLNNLAVIYNNTHRAVLAAETYLTALRLQRRIGDRDGQAVTLGNLMILWQPTQPAAAIWCGKEAVNIYQEIRGSLQMQSDDPSGELQKGFAASRESVYRTLADVLISQGRLTEARQVLRMLKQEEFFDFLGRDPKSAPALQQRVTLTADECEGQKRYAALTADAPLTPLFEEMTIALRASRSADNVIPGSSESGGLTQALTTLGPGTVAIYTIVEPDKLRLIIVTANSQRAAEYPIAAKDLYRKVLAFRNALQDPFHDPRPLAQDLYKIILGPLQADLKQARAATLLWSLDDALRYLPLAALHDGKGYLVERYDMSVFTPAGENRLAQGRAPQWRGLGLGVSLAHEDFPALPGVPQELNGIMQGQPGRAAGVLPGTVLLNSGFTRQTLIQALEQNRGSIARYLVVHIASHFNLSSRDNNSFLLLGDGRHLSVAQIKANPHFFQGVDLLTLSACNTAIDVKSASGKEVEGFGALAQRLGARSVLASLWPVADASTPVLMREFYRLHRVNPKRGKAAGLREAQLELLRGRVRSFVPASTANRANRAKIAGAANTDLPLFTADPHAPYAHPYYWAPFVLIGNPQ